VVYCPNCHSDHPKELLVCPDCNHELIENSGITQPVAEAPDESWVPVANLKGRRLAERAKTSLDSNNIPSMIVPHSFARPFNAPSNSDGAFEISGTDNNKLIMVPQEYKEEAAMLIKNFLKKELI
jgi:hypothetical protein